MLDVANDTWCAGNSPDGAGTTEDRQAALEARRLSVEFKGQLVLDEIDFRMGLGQVVAVTGRNGAGKTTLLRCLAGLLRPTSGDVHWFGQSPRRNQILRRSIGMVAHQRFLYEDLTARENLLFAARMCDVRHPDSRVEQLLGESGLQRRADQPAASLSQGMRQRLSICRAVVHDPPILLLDEPLSGIDDDGRQWLGGLLLQLRARARAICLTTHENSLACRLADRVLRLENGKLNDRTQIAGGTHLHELWCADAA